MILGCKGRIFFIVVYFVYLLILLECVNIFIIDEIYDLIKGLLDYENLSKLFIFLLYNVIWLKKKYKNIKNYRYDFYKEKFWILFILKRING